jgi:ABC-type cobalamin transport system permease subunit
MRTLVNVLSSIPGGGSLVNGYFACPLALPGVVGMACGSGVVWVVVWVAELPPALLPPLLLG